MDGILKFPIARLSKNLHHKVKVCVAGGERIDYLPTDLISGTKSGSRSAYETPLNVVPISKARTSFLEDPE